MLTNGLGWVLDKDCTLADNILRAAERHKRRFGKWPDAILVGSSDHVQAGGLKVFTHHAIGRSYDFLIGVDE